MASQSRRMWLHDEDNTIKVLPFTTIDSIKIQPNTNEDIFTDFQDDYNDVKTTITNNKNATDRSLNNLDTRVTALENAGGASGSIGLATHSAPGLMSAEDKEKIDGIDDEANKYVLPRATTSLLGGVKVDGTTVSVDNDGTIHAIGGSGGASAISGLSDVQIRALLDGDVLVYDHSSRKWVNKFPEEVFSEGGGSASIEYISFDDIISLFNTNDVNYYYDLNKEY